MKLNSINMKPIFLFILIIISGEIFSQTTRDTTRIIVGDSMVVTVVTTVNTTASGTVSYNYPVKTTTITQYKVALGSTQPPNQIPTVNAGNDQTITLPLNSVNLNGVATDKDGTISSYLWTRVSGPTQFTIASPTTASTSVNGLVPGTYVFKLTVVDNDAASASDNVSITVNQQGQPVDTSSTKPEGFGANNPGGMGKPVYRVTNLNSSGVGSLANGLKSNTYIVFDVAGSIEARFELSNISFVTIDGTTAPSPGITLTNDNNGNCLSFNNSTSNNIVVKNIRVRGNAGNDAVNCVDGAHDILFDHISVSGAHDGNLDISAGCYNITVQYSIIAKGSSDWSGAMLLGYVPTRNLSIHHNLFSAVTNGGVGERIPFIRANENSATYNDMIVEFKNNLVWGWGRSGGTGSGYATGFDFAGTGMIINNYYYSKSAGGDAVKYDVDPTKGSGYKAYVSGNFSGNNTSFPASNVSAWVIPTQYQVATQSPCDAARKVLAKAGCQPLDSEDRNYINQVTLPGCPAQ